MPEVLSVLLLILRWVHFLGGVVWIGTIVYLGIVQFPGMKGPKAENLSSESVSKLNSLLVITSISSVVAGVSMALIFSSLNTGIFTSTNWGISIFVGGLFTLAALVTTFAGVLPALERLASRKLSDDERSTVVGEGQTWINITIVLGVLVLLMMASAASL